MVPPKLSVSPNLNGPPGQTAEGTTIVTNFHKPFPAVLAKHQRKDKHVFSDKYTKICSKHIPKNATNWDFSIVATQNLLSPDSLQAAKSPERDPSFSDRSYRITGPVHY